MKELALPKYPGKGGSAEGRIYQMQWEHVKDSEGPFRSPVVAPMSKRPSQLPRQHVEVPWTWAPLDSISWWLNDMLSTPFSPHMINYESSKGFVVLKFMMYVGMSDPFNHIMHFRQLMTLYIRNDGLMCKVFLANLHNPTLLVPLSLTEFCEHIPRYLRSICGPLPTFRSPKAEHKHPTEHQVTGEQVA